MRYPRKIAPRMVIAATTKPPVVSYDCLWVAWQNSQRVSACCSGEEDGMAAGSKSADASVHTTGARAIHSYPFTNRHTTVETESPATEARVFFILVGA